MIKTIENRRFDLIEFTDGSCPVCGGLRALISKMSIGEKDYCEECSREIFPIVIFDKQFYQQMITHELFVGIIHQLDIDNCRKRQYYDECPWGDQTHQRDALTNMRSSWPGDFMFGMDYME
jgi:hypothetical protein